MESACSSEQDALRVEPDSFSPAPLVERGLSCIEQGHYAEGAAFLALAREQLFFSQVQLSAVLDALNQAIASHMHARQALHEASKRFAESNSEQQAQVAALKKLLPALREQRDMASHAAARAQKNASSQHALRLLQPAKAATLVEHTALPALYITCFGHFEVRRFSPSAHPLNLCTNLKGQAVLRYLMAQPKHRATVDMLLEVLWPEDEPGVAEHKLRIAVSALRCSLNRDVVREAGGGYILCKGQVYQLNPAVVLQSDVEQFLALYRSGREAAGGSEAVTCYEKACELYTGPFLMEDLYAEWSSMPREELAKVYVAMCSKLAESKLESGCWESAIQWASEMLKVDRCDEEAHRQLMRAYAARGCRSEALRQYQQCQKVLAEELGVQPMPETQKLFQMLLN